MPHAEVIVEEFNQLPSESLRGEIANFLADFVASGGLEKAFPGDDDPEVWRQRLTWWWQDNPFVSPGLTLAYVMRNEGGAGRIVGFHGFIPHDYVADGSNVPTLITTTFFVEEAYRTHSMKIVLKLNKLARQFQLLDGTPSPEMRAILDKFQFENRTKLRRYNLLVKRSGLRSFKSRALRLAGFAKPMRAPQLRKRRDLRVITSPDQIVSVPEWSDESLRRAATIPGLRWMTNIGNGERQFFGLIDEAGELQAFAIGLLKSSRGVTACRVLEYGSFDDDDTALLALLARIASAPGECGLSNSVDVILWSVFDGAVKTLPDVEPETRESALYFKVPSQWQDRPKTCLPSEGDLVLL